MWELYHYHKGNMTIKRLTFDQKRKMVEHFLSLGFDLSSYGSGPGVYLGCSKCDARVINGHPCHEQGCPNVRDRSTEQ